MNQTKLLEFKKTITDYYAGHKRAFPWRESFDPYHVVVSEIMLQQTQTHRVIEKYELFITAFPTFQALAQAPLRDVLIAWQGLGYNRRAKFLQQTAYKVTHEYGGILPADPAVLATFPGIGNATAGSICAFAFNMPTVFIETNIRAVYIHFFFKNRESVTDKELFPLVAQTVDQLNPREWYYALMDYGVMLKKRVINPSRASAHHVVQSKFEGSERQIRGMILKLLTTESMLSFDQLAAHIQKEPRRIQKNLAALCVEGFIKQNGEFFEIG